MGVGRPRRGSPRPENPGIDADTLHAFGAAELLPPSLAPWRPLLVEGLQQFLNGLPPPRLAEIAAAQLALDADATPAERLLALLRQSPTLHKLGQVVARQPHLDAALRQRLKALESMPADDDLAPILRRLRAELPVAGLAIGDAALAQGSVAVVLPFDWRQDGRVQEGVFKVLRPGVRERLADELALLPEVAAFLARRGLELGLPPLDYAGVLDDAGRLLAREVRLEVEQAHLREAAAFYARDERIRVPRLLPWCAPWVTAMERVHGVPLGDARQPPRERARLAADAMSALIAGPFWTRDDPAVFHGDLHGGNLLAAPDGRIAVLDWALTARVGKRQREATVAAVIGGLTLDADRIGAALAELGAPGMECGELRPMVERSLDRLVRCARPAGFAWLLALLDELALAGGIRFDAQLSVFRKTWMALAGVLGDLAGETLPDAVIFEGAVRAFAADWPRRWLPSSGAADFASHVSNPDLVAAASSGWLTGLRYWSRLWDSRRTA